MLEKVVSRKVVIALSVIVVVLVSSLIGVIMHFTSIIQSKDDKISNLCTQITTLNANISELENKIAQQNKEIIRLEKIENLTNQILYLHKPYNYEGEWLGTWRLVTEFSGSSALEKSPTFQIKSVYNLWRINYSHIGEKEAGVTLEVVQQAGTEEWVIGSFSITGPSENHTIYFFDYNVFSRNTYYITMSDYKGIYRWDITIEELT
jgi:outer membrane murein-binding lipoprotein Lpp